MRPMGQEWFEKLRARREELGWTPAHLAMRAKVSRPQIVHIEAGDVRYPRRETVMALAEALGIDYDALYARKLHEELTIYDPLDPQLEQIQVNLKAIKRLDPEKIDELADIILAVKEKTEREAQS